MSDDAQATSDEGTVTANIKLSGPSWNMAFKLTVPAGPTTLKELLPLAQKLSDAVVNATVQGIEQSGAKISCSKGCGACCRQLVPISDVEARRIAELVQSLPEPQQTQVRARFDDAVRKFADAGLLEKLRDPERWHREGYVPFGLEYFRQGVPCPFLVDESCSIHADRPITCREFLVTSPAIHCQNPTAETVKAVKLPLQVAQAVAEFQLIETAPHLVQWVPLVLALEWGETHPDPPAIHTGPELIDQLMQQLTGKTPPKMPPSDSEEASRLTASAGLMGAS